MQLSHLEACHRLRGPGTRHLGRCTRGSQTNALARERRRLENTGPFSAAPASAIQNNRHEMHKHGSIEGVETPAVVPLGVLHPTLEPLLLELEWEECEEQSSRMSRAQ
jgi:hypothetical protein